MKLPFLSRDAFEIAVAAERRRADAEHENAQALRRDYTDLLSRFTMLRLQGASEPPAPPVLREAKEPDACVAAINARTRGNPGLRNAALRQLAMDRAAQKHEMEILAEIERGVSLDGVPA